MKSLILLLFFSLAQAQQPRWRVASGTEGSPGLDVDIFLGDPDTLYAISGGSKISSDRGEHWDTMPVSGPGPPVEVDPLDSRILYGWFLVPWGERFGRTTDRGQTWTYISDVHSLGRPLVEIDPVDTYTVYASRGPSFILKSTDRGETWNLLPTPPEAHVIASLAIAPSDHNTLYAGFVSGMFKSTDRGCSWTQLPWGIFANGYELAVDPYNPDIIYAALFNYNPPPQVYKSTDGGTTWVEKSNGLTSEESAIRTIVIHQKNPRELYLGTWSQQGRALFRTTNGAEVWEPYANGLPDTGSVVSIAIDTLNGRMYAAAAPGLGEQDGGIYILDTVTTDVRPPTDQHPQAFTLRQNYPNPFNSQTTIQFSLSQRTKVQLKVYSLLGQEIKTLLDKIHEAGSYSVLFDAKNLSSGIYVYRLITLNHVQSKWMVILR